MRDAWSSRLASRLSHALFPESERMCAKRSDGELFTASRPNWLLGREVLVLFFTCPPLSHPRCTLSSRTTTTMYNNEPETKLESIFSPESPGSILSRCGFGSRLQRRPSISNASNSPSPLFSSISRGPWGVVLCRSRQPVQFSCRGPFTASHSQV
jgi:hypothetical protein